MKAFSLCYIKHGGKTLMLHRIKKDHDVHEGKWNGLGGKMLPGEAPHECVAREVKEESGLTIHDPCLKGVMTFPKFKDDEDWLVFLFVAKVFSGELQECPEGELHWIEDEKLDQLDLWEGDRYFLKWMEERPLFSAKFCYENKQLKDHSVVFF